MLKNLILWPLSVLYGIGVSIRNRLFNLGILKIREFDVPIICVGNITVGGTGKTPHTESLINELKNDYRVACLSRGYKRKTSGFVLATENSTANDIGNHGSRGCGSSAWHQETHATPGKTGSNHLG